MKDYPELKVDYPRFFRGGNRFRKSDLPRIKARLDRLGDENRKFACDEYERIYLTHFNQGKYALAAEMANKFLMDFTTKYGISKDEVKQIKASENTQKRINELIQKCKNAKPKASKILDMADRKKPR